MIHFRTAPVVFALVLCLAAVATAWATLSVIGELSTLMYCTHALSLAISSARFAGTCWPLTSWMKIGRPTASATARKYPLTPSAPGCMNDGAVSMSAIM